MALPLIPIVSALTSVVPTIAKWIGGDKAEDAANHVADIARAVTGNNDTETAVNMILKDESLKLQFMMQIENNRQALDEAYLKDRQHAREQHKHSAMPSVIVVALTLMVAAMGCAMFMSVIPAENSDLANILFGAVLAKWADSVAYWMGSSRGSAEKDRRR
ncbi:TMhelix containing protein [Vibrio phage 1.206.O._10N.222.51.B10]|nr:TMhelix containing protein [Vibrio phage 1.206.O._10N.222.51.B10]